MKIFNYTNLDDLKDTAREYDEDLTETQMSYSFRIFKGRNCTELHILHTANIKEKKPEPVVVLAPQTSLRKEENTQFNPELIQKVNSSKNHMNGERGDCSVIAMAYAFGLSYDAAHELCAKHGRKRGCGFNPGKILKVNALKKYKQFMNRGVSYHQYKKNRPTVRTFIKNHPKGTYMVFVTEHVFTMVDGIPRNQYELGQHVQYYYYISKPFNQPNTGAQVPASQDYSLKTSHQ